MAKVVDVVGIMEYIAPSWMACKGDVNGLQAGSLVDSVKKVLVALDATDRVVDYAVKNKCQMIVTHHPRFYAPLSNICKDTFLGNLAYKLCRNNIAFFNAHTNFDIAPGGVNDILADIVGIDDRQVVDAVVFDELLKLSVFVDEEHIEDVREAVCGAGAGEIGNYSECSYKTLGIGGFVPQEGSKPYVGKIGDLYESEEWKLEVLLPMSLKSGVERAMLDAHPYETPAYEFTETFTSERYGFGRVGNLKKAISLTALAKKFKKATASSAVQVLEGKSSKINRVAVWSGSGVNIEKVVSSGAECVVCGELGYHYAEELEYHGISAVVLGHCPCEEIALGRLSESLQSGLDGVEVLVAPRLSPDFKAV